MQLLDKAFGRPRRHRTRGEATSQPVGNRLLAAAPTSPGRRRVAQQGGVGLLARGDAGAFHRRPAMAGGVGGSIGSADVPLVCHRARVAAAGRRRRVRLIRDRRGRHDIFGRGWPVAGSA